MTARRPPERWQDPPRIAQRLSTPFGPCTRCRAQCRRYGPGGNPLCPACHPATRNQTDTADAA